jgi:hypothetical protein
MIIKRGFALFIIVFLLGSVFSVSAQDESDNEGDGDEIPVEPDWVLAPQSLYALGDKTFVISLGALFPVLFLNEQFQAYETGYPVGNVNIGATGSLGFNYFLSSNIFVGAELQGMFASTLAQNMYYLVPIGLRGGYQFILSRFEFPVSLFVGMILHSYNNSVGYLGLILKPEASAYWRFNSEWSFGVNTAWWWVPQWPAVGGASHTRYGNFLEVSLSARYHF